MLLITPKKKRKIKYSYIMFLKSINHKFLIVCSKICSIFNIFHTQKKKKNPKNSMKKKIVRLILNSIYEIHHTDCTRPSFIYERSYYIRSSCRVSPLIFGGLCTFMRPTYCKRTQHETIFS